MPELIKSHNWKFRLSIKTYLSSQTDPESINSVCIHIAKDLEKLLVDIEKSDVVAYDKQEYMDEVQEIMGNLHLMSDLCLGKISPSQWEDYHFSGDFIGRLSNYMFELYELGDSRVETTKGISEKLLWVG